MRDTMTIHPHDPGNRAVLATLSFPPASYRALEGKVRAGAPETGRPVRASVGS